MYFCTVAASYAKAFTKTTFQEISIALCNAGTQTESGNKPLIES